MLPAIGFIVAIYTMFRYIETLGKPETTVFGRVLSVLALLATLGLCSTLWGAGSTIPNLYH